MAKDQVFLQTKLAFACRCMGVALLLLALLSTMLSTAPANATPPTAASTRAVVHGRRHPPPPPTVSLGYPFQGRLRNGRPLIESSTVRYAGEYARTGNFYGTEELIGLLSRAAEHVQRRTRGGKLSVGELSRRTGGSVPGHRSHQNGRDVDIAFYMLDGNGRSFDPYGFANFDRNGVGMAPNQALRFDDVRNWELVARLLSDPDARVQYVFVADTLKHRLLRTARARRAAPALIHRAEVAMMQPTHGHPHRNHFHVRIYCPPSDRPLCEDRTPFHPWYPGTPPHAASTAAHEAGD